MRLPPGIHPYLRRLVFSCLLAHVVLSFTQAQQVPQKPTEKPTAKASAAPTEPQNPYEIELLETRYRFEANGDSRKEVHTRVHLNNELGVRQFARLNFDYNRSFQSIEIPLVHITHPSGGTADILPSAITDNPNPAVINAPAYQDVRVKSVRILGLEPGDLLEYRILTTTARHPLAPDFWLDHTFDRSGVVSKEIFEIDLPSSREHKIRINPRTPAPHSGPNSNGDRTTYRWELSSSTNPSTNESPSDDADVQLTTFPSWEVLSSRLADLLLPRSLEPHKWVVSPKLSQKAAELVKSARTPLERVENLYEFVSENISTVDLPLGATGFKTRSETDILSSRYASPEDKFKVFVAMIRGYAYPSAVLFANGVHLAADSAPRPGVFGHLLIKTPVQVFDVPCGAAKVYWVDLSPEVAPFGVVASSFRGRTALELENSPFGRPPERWWVKIPDELPFPSTQIVKINAVLDGDGKLTAKVHYALRGDNEVLLRIGFHQTTKDKWKELAQLLSLSDGFRGQVTSVTASDPYATREPFTVDYEIVQPKFVDWSKKPVRTPAPLPQLGLPDPPAKPAPGAATTPIELGTPLEVETKMTLRLPPSTDVEAPTGTSVQRDYATYASQYSIQGLTVTASRRINFLLRQVPPDRAADYNAFFRAVQNDQAQDFTLNRESSPAPAAKP